MPLTGAVFGLAAYLLGSVHYEAVLPSFPAAIVADAVTRAWGVGHTAYPALPAVPLTRPGLRRPLLARALSGLAVRGFATLTHWLSRQLGRPCYPPLRPVLGGALVATARWALGTMRYASLGVPVVLEIFWRALPAQDFARTLALTSLMLGDGSKGGEVTPLFFIGAVLAGLGFVGVLAGAANTPLACLLMGLELPGTRAGIYLGLACVVAYLLSGHSGSYAPQQVGQFKHPLPGRLLGALHQPARRP